jgi:DNA-binding NarL/FixJ family response regulator
MEKIKILIVDDHPVVREGIATMLKKEKDFQIVDQAKDGKEAISKSASLLPDIVLMDLRMPGIDGVQAMREINKLGKNIKFVVLTTYDNDEYIFEGIEAGARAYLLKDAPRSELFLAIRAVYDGHSLIQPPVAKKVLDRFTKMSREIKESTGFSNRELEVLGLIAQGLGNKDIGERLYLSESTVKTYVHAIFNRLGVTDRAQAVMEAVKKGILHP